MPQRPRLAFSLVALALLAGCVTLPANDLGTQPQRITELRPGSLVGRNAGSLVGKVKMAPSGIIATNGSAIIASNGSAIIAPGASRYNLLAASLEAAAGAKVRVLSETGKSLYAGAVTADDEGRYAVRRLLTSGPVVFVEATLEVGGLPVMLVGAVGAPRRGRIEANLSPGSTLVAEKLRVMLQASALSLAGFETRRLARVVEAVEAAMDSESQVAACVLSGKDAARYFDRWVEGQPALAKSLKEIIGGHALEALMKPTPAPSPESPEESPTPRPSAEPAPPAVATARGVFGVAGYGLAGYADGAPGKARFNVPYDVATDEDGNVYVADSENHAVRRVAPNGAVSTIAGDGTPGFADGQGKAARFRELSGVAVGPDGTLYVADYANHRVRKIDKDGLVTTLAGDGTPGLTDGVGQAAQLNNPTDLTVDREGVVYVSDEGNHAVRRISPEGVVTTLVGNGAPGFTDGPLGVGQLNMPSDVALDISGHLYVADTENHAVRKVSPDGVMTTLAGGGEPGYADGQGAAARFHTPYGIVVNDEGTVYVADSNNDAVREISALGLVSTFGGGPAGYRLANTEAPLFKVPSGLAIRRNGQGEGEVFVADAFNHRVTKFRIRITDEEQMVPK